MSKYVKKSMARRKSSRRAYTESVEEIRARGEVALRIGLLWLSGAVLCLLIVGALALTFLRPESSKDIWVIIGPILSVAVSGSVSYLAGTTSLRQLKEAG